MYFCFFGQIIWTVFLSYPMSILTCKSCENGKTDVKLVLLNACQSEVAEFSVLLCQCNFYFQEIKSCK